MDLKTLLQAENVAVQLEVADKEQLIQIMIDMVSGRQEVQDPKKAFEAVWQREQIMSTGVGKGLALPHAKTGAVSGLVTALVTLKTPIPFGASDEDPVSIAFLLLNRPDAKSQHVRLLSRVSRLMNNDKVRKSIIDSPSREELLHILHSDQITD